MGDFGDAERRILAFMAEGTEFMFQEKNYKIILSGNQHAIKVSLKQIFIFSRIVI